MIARRFKWGLPLLCLAMLGGCTKKKGNSLEINIHYPKVQVRLDPHRMEDAYSMMIVMQLYRGLLRFNPTGDTVPDLAESWTESADRKVYRFKLREATFSNGEKITAKHVQYSFARIFLLGAGMAADIDYIKGTKEFLKSKDINDFGVKAVSDGEVEFQLAYPSALFLKHIAVADCAVMPFVSLNNISDHPTAFSGPYKLEGPSTGDNFHLVKWRKDSLESKTPPQKIHFFGTTEEPVSLAKSGKTDTLDRDHVSSSDQKELESRGWGASPTELTGETFIILNPKFLNEELRRYLYLKTDPVEIVAKLKEGQFKPSYGLIPTGFPGEMSAEDVKSLRKETITYKGKKASFKFDFDPSSEVEKKIADYLKSTWTSDLVDVELNPMSKGDKLQRMFEKKSEAVLGRKGIDYPDGFSVLTYFKGKYESNYYFVDKPEIDASIAEAVKEFDSNKRADLYKKIQLQILREYTLVPVLFGSQASGLWSEKIKRAPSHPMGYHTMPFETIEMRLE